MNKKRLYILLPAILFCTLVFSQHPHSRGGSPFYWALVGAIAYGGLYLIYLLFGYLIKLVKRNKTREQSSDIVQSTERTLKSTENLEETDKKEMVDSSQKDTPKKLETKQVYCRFCGRQIDEDDVFCPRCGKKQNINKASWNVKSLSGQAKTVSHKLLAWIRIPYDYARKSVSYQMSKERSDLWRKRIIRTCKILFAVVVVAIILGGGALGLSYYYDEYIPKKKLDAAVEEIISNIKSKNDSIKAKYALFVLVKNHQWGYEGVSDYDITSRLIDYRERSFKFIESKAYGGDPKWQFRLGQMYRWADNRYYYVQQDLTKAAYWWNEAASNNYIQAYNNLGIAYKEGQGVDVDMRKAVEYLRKGAEAGEDWAQMNYGDLFMEGVIVKSGSHKEIYTTMDYQFSNDYIRSYYTNDDRKVYVKEREVDDYDTLIPKDIEQAKSWWEKSAVQGNENAKERLQKIY